MSLFFLIFLVLVCKCGQFWRVRKPRLSVCVDLGPLHLGIPHKLFWDSSHYIAIGPQDFYLETWGSPDKIGKSMLLMTLSWKSHNANPSTLPCFLVSSLVIFNQASSPRGHYTLPVSEGDRTLEDNVGWKPLAWSSLVDRIDYISPLNQKPKYSRLFYYQAPLPPWSKIRVSFRQCSIVWYLNVIINFMVLDINLRLLYTLDKCTTTLIFLVLKWNNKLDNL